MRLLAFSTAFDYIKRLIFCLWLHWGLFLNEASIENRWPLVRRKRKTLNLWITTPYDVSFAVKWRVPSWLITLLPNSAAWWHGSASTLAPVIGGCLTALNHYIKRRLIIMQRVSWHSPQGIFRKNLTKLNLRIVVGHYNKIANTSPIVIRFSIL